jgi:hypothetical protein
MSTILDSHRAFHRVTAGLFALLTPEQKRAIAALQPDPTLAQRVEELADKANEGELTEAEREEYEAYIEANDFLAILQAEARFQLQNGKS